MPNFDNAPRTLKGAPLRAHLKGHTQRAHTQRAHGGKRTGKPAAGVLAILTLACLGLTACGGSSGNSTNAAATGAVTAGTSGASSTSGSPSQGNKSGAGRPGFSAIRECLRKNSVTLPKRTPGSGGPAGGAFLGAGGGAGGPRLPKGMTRPQFEAALKKCGGGNFGARFGKGATGARRINSPVFRAALVKYAACLRQNGVNIPAPNTSGKGPIFGTKGIDTSSPRFRAATMKCRGTLIGAFRRPPGAGAANGTSGSPPAGGQAQGGESSG
jgi:hypothetical protein